MCKQRRLSVCGGLRIIIQIDKSSKYGIYICIWSANTGRDRAIQKREGRSESLFFKLASLKFLQQAQRGRNDLCCELL